MAEDPSSTPGARSGGMSRRRLLKLGLAGGVTLAAGSAGGLLSLRGCAPHVPGLRVLGDHEYRTVAALARVHVPEGGPFEPGAARFDLARLFDAFLADEPAEKVAELRQALLLFEYGPVLFEGRLATFSNLDPEEQLHHWQAWMSSGRLVRRKVATGLRKFLSFAFYSQPEIAPLLGYAMPHLAGG